MQEQISRDATEYLYFPGIIPFDAESPDYTPDPTGLPIHAALVAPQVHPVEDDWSEAEWVSFDRARVLVGPDGGITKQPGTWVAWLWVEGTVEKPRRPVGTVVVT